MSNRLHSVSLRNSVRLAAVLLMVLGGAVGCATTTPVPRPAAGVEFHVLTNAQTWALTPPTADRFDASALLRLPDGTLLTVNDKSLPACRIQTLEGGSGFLVPEPGLFSPTAVAALPGSAGAPVDAEGLARDGRGRIYLCAEARRWILRWDPADGTVERLPIDWSPVERWFSTRDGNASFEGIAVGGNRLYVANERESARILVVDLDTLGVVDDFTVVPPGIDAGGVQYADLCWAEGSLWVLCRPQRCVLRVAPETREIQAVYDYSAVETHPANAYFSVLSIGFVEGLSVEADAIWLLVDNNGFPRRSALRDTRPLLFRCPRPDRPGTAP